MDIGGPYKWGPPRRSRNGLKKGERNRLLYNGFQEEQELTRGEKFRGKNQTDQEFRGGKVETKRGWARKVLSAKGRRESIGPNEKSRETLDRKAS